MGVDDGEYIPGAKANNVANPGRLFGIGEGEVGAEADHAEAGGGALATAKDGAMFEFLFEGSGEENDEQIGKSVERDGDGAENEELQEDVAATGRDELRNERKEEQGGFGIERFGEDALAEGAERRSGDGDVHFRVASTNHADTEEDEISGAGIFNGVKSDGGSSEDGGDAQGGGDDVEESAEESAEGGVQTFVASAGEGAGENVEDAGAGSDGEDKSSSEEQKEVASIEHDGSLPVYSSRKPEARGAIDGRVRIGLA